MAKVPMDKKVPAIPNYYGSLHLNDPANNQYVWVQTYGNVSIWHFQHVGITNGQSVSSLFGFDTHPIDSQVWAIMMSTNEGAASEPIMLGIAPNGIVNGYNAASNWTSGWLYGTIVFCSTVPWSTVTN